jgi:type III secretion protein V
MSRSFRAMAGPTQAAAPLEKDLGSVLKRHADMGLALVVVVIVGMMIIPLPVFILDVFIVANMSMSVILLLVAIYVTEALKIATFPTLLLITTLFRLALEVSATRLILLKGDAGHVIDAFGNFVVAGNLVVGAVIFFILTIIQFIVIAKGSERVAEVGARFTLDAMPGKQMSIDAELRAGAIDHVEARRRRRNLGRESQFFGSMDGAMKFVKGDAIAGIIVLVTNIVGGLIIGIVQRDMDAATAARTYTVLTIGEGLVAQIPALVISTAAGIIVTRVASEETGSNLGGEIFRQLTGQPKALAIAAGLMVLLAIVPGFPAIPFLLMAAGSGTLAWKLMKSQKEAAEASARPAARPGAPAKPAGGTPAKPDAGGTAIPERPAPVRTPIIVEISDALTDSFFPDGTTGSFFDVLVPTMRGEVFTEIGIALPGVRLRGRIGTLKPNAYRFQLYEVPTGAGEIELDHVFAEASPEALQQRGLTGTPAKLPDGGQGVWLSEADGERAREAGVRVLSGASVMLRHLVDTIRRFAHEFIGIEEVQALLEGVQRSHPAVVREVVPKIVSPIQLTDILKRLAEEGVSLRAMVEILGALGEWAPVERDPVALTEHVRAALRRQITARYIGADGTLPVYLLDPMIEENMRESIQRTPTGTYLALEPAMSRNIIKAVAATMAAHNGPPPVLLTNAEIRRFLRRLVEGDNPRLAVLSYQEVTPETKLQQLGRIRLS